MGQIQSIRHIGIYVRDLDKMVQFYEKLGFGVLTQYIDTGRHLELITGNKKTEMRICKLLTPYGKRTGQGDMLELLEYSESGVDSVERELFASGVAHLALGTEDIHGLCEIISNNGGTVLFDPVQVEASGNKFVFCRDPEGNYLELIQQSGGKR